MDDVTVLLITLLPREQVLNGGQLSQRIAFEFKSDSTDIMVELEFYIIANNEYCYIIKLYD